MYYVKKTLEIAGAHFLELPYESKCGSIHGHNWKIVVYARARALTSYGMVVDFSEIKKVVMAFDHKYLNGVIQGHNPTAEIFAHIIANKLAEKFQSQSNHPVFYRIDVIESDGNEASYELSD